jgi:hypothetical protein
LPVHLFNKIEKTKNKKQKTTLSIDDVLSESWVNLTHHCLCQVQIDHIIVFTHGFCLYTNKVIHKDNQVQDQNLQFGLETEVGQTEA